MVGGEEGIRDITDGNSTKALLGRGEEENVLLTHLLLAVESFF
jgi:hypothetical protein